MTGGRDLNAFSTPLPDMTTYYATDCYEGLSKIEYAAIHFGQAMLASPELMQVVTSGSILDGTAAQKVAKFAIQYANALFDEFDELKNETK